MYNLLVTAQEGAWDQPTYALSTDRYLEYTDDEVKGRFITLDDVTVGVLQQLPTLFAYERFVKSPARVGQLTSIRKRGSNVTISFAVDPEILPVTPDQLETLLPQLDIERFEMNRTHFAVKQVDLLGALREAGLLRRHGQRPHTPATVENRARAARPSRKVFLVHGRNAGVKREVAEYLRQHGLEVIILHERPNKGRTLISKFREESTDIGFAIVLMTPDDVGGLARGLGRNPRARQNVVFELGYLIGKLGPECVCALIAGRLERPSDFEGVVYVKYDSKGAWKSTLARELREANIPLDSSKGP